MPAEAAVQGFIQVLYVEDQPVVGAIILLELQRTGVAVTTARNGDEALELARQSRFDLILMDVLLVGASGFDTCRLLRNDPLLKALPVIFFTGVPTEQGRQEALELGAVAYLNKGLERAQLAEWILAAVEVARSGGHWPAIKATGPLSRPGDSQQSLGERLSVGAERTP